MATTRKQGADNPNQDATADSAHNQQNNHAQTPDQAAANHGAFAQSSYQNTQRAGDQTPSAGAASSTSSESSGNALDTAVQAGKKWLDESGVLNKTTELPQAAKEWGTKALGSVNALSTTQKVVGGTLLLAGVAYLSTRGKSKSKSKSKSDDMDYRAGGKSEGYRQGSWAGYAGGKSASARNSAAGSRSDVSSYGAERRAAGGSQGSSYGRNAGSADTDFGSGGSNANRSGASRTSRTSSMGATGTEGRGQSSNQASNQGSGNYRSGSSYNAGRSSGSASSSPSSMGKAGSSANRDSLNSNEEDYDTSF